MKAESGANLNESLIFFDHSELVLHKAPSSSEKPKDDMSFKHNEYMQVVKNDAKRLATRLKADYKETEGDKVIA